MHVVVGATGGAGAAVVEELVARGEKVLAVSRGGGAVAGAEGVAADASDQARMREVCAGASVVYNCVNPPFGQWMRVFPEVVRALSAAAGAAGAVLAFADDTWMYGRVDGPMREDTAVRPVTDFGVFRAWLAELTMAGHHRGEVRVVIARGGELYGPRVESVLGQNLFGRVVAGRRPVWLGDPELPITPTFIGDFARALVTVAADPAAHGEIWHVPNDVPTTGREFMGVLGAQVGKAAKPVTISSSRVWPLKAVSAVVRQGASLLYQFEQPFVVDSGKFRSRYDFEPTRYDDGIARTIAWYRANPHLVRAGLVPR
ncbi:NAD-dependent epimerase/dehydratase family protein [Amycolatopsis sp. cg5]|uniref:NAD-dependent epimerase/dehydratase family protein n=1 Tax=Amycolatopsis sp. cg5 TaxID=3238802 RepID=UPI0035261CA8